ncbi:protein phosphatase inhibitor protein [Cystoisospora suis]|uniref:Protein phosphatase inhibitor protein n=1 Tax=Cystoisospora suis TaxID=483139 RepID=A0A2C6KM98_9APIC|nr:protein phosphatase inhibitor protein [Cystoisospora suis]
MSSRSPTHCGGSGARSGGSSSSTTTTTLMPQAAAVVHISPSPSSGDVRAALEGDGERGTLLSSSGSPQGEHSPRRVSWDQNIVDNENMAKKKSKKCCIFHKKKPFGESSSESDSSSGNSSGDEEKANHQGTGGQGGEGGNDGHSTCKKCVRETRQKNLEATGKGTEGQTS